MSELRSLLIEVGCEELPPKALDELSSAFSKGICDGMVKRGIGADTANAKVYNSPRRLAVLVPGVADQQAHQKSEALGPYLNIGLDANGEPTAALRGFAAKNGLGVEQLQRVTDAKGERFVARSEQVGQPIGALMPDILVEAIKSLPIPKPMRWSDHDFSFVRPMHWLVVLHGTDVIDAEVFGIKSGRASRGHRFHHSDAVTLSNVNEYVETLRAAKVIVDPQERRERVHEEVGRAAHATGGTPRISAALCDEIANLVEWPRAITCKFDREFLSVPQEALITTMETNQKFVPVFDAAGKLSEHFIGVANIESKDPAEIRKGYERVIRPRFADAKFFYDEDLKTPLAAHQEALKSVTYQQQLGSVWDKCVRVAELSRVIANRLKDAGFDIDPAMATRAAALCKCDLMTRMVGEFPELQGVMGRYYASANGEPTAIAQALDEFYRPRFAGDTIAQGDIARVLAIAERLDTLAGIFAVGQKPSGSKDPFALRRAGLGLARSLIESGFDLDLEALLREAVELLPHIEPVTKSKSGKTNAPVQGKGELARELTEFVIERLRGYYAERGISNDQFDAVRAVEPESLLDFDQRVHAVAQFAQMPEASALAAANKRIGNILRQAGGAVSGAVEKAALDAGAESELHRHIESTTLGIAPLLAQRNYIECLRALAALRGPVDAFFDAVMVMADDAGKRRNRLLMLAHLRRLFLDVADISVLQSD